MFPFNNIILASSSPRRKQLLKQIGVDFTTEVSGVDESINLDISPEKVAKYFALEKARKPIQIPMHIPVIAIRVSYALLSSLRSFCLSRCSFSVSAFFVVIVFSACFLGLFLASALANALLSVSITFVPGRIPAISFLISPRRSMEAQLHSRALIALMRPS